MQPALRYTPHATLQIHPHLCSQVKLSFELEPEKSPKGLAYYRPSHSYRLSGLWNHFNNRFGENYCSHRSKYFSGLFPFDYNVG